MFTRGGDIFLGCLVAAVLAAVNTSGSSKYETISNPDPTTIIPVEAAAFMVQLRMPGNLTVCSGTLISLQHVLTAAHCVDEEVKVLEQMTVVAGASLCNGTGVESKIAKIFVHPNRESSPFQSDVAVLKLVKPFEAAKKIQVVKKLCSAAPVEGEHIHVSGWGEIASVPNKDNVTLKYLSAELRRVELPIISNDACLQKISPFLPPNATLLDTTNICGYKQSYDSCVTNSGGAGIYKDELCAVVSWGIGCGLPDQPGVYASVYAVLDFINEKLRV